MSTDIISLFLTRLFWFILLCSLKNTYERTLWTFVCIFAALLSCGFGTRFSRSRNGGESSRCLLWSMRVQAQVPQAGKRAYESLQRWRSGNHQRGDSPEHWLVRGPDCGRQIAALQEEWRWLR